MILWEKVQGSEVFSVEQVCKLGWTNSYVLVVVRQLDHLLELDVEHLLEGTAEQVGPLVVRVKVEVHIHVEFHGQVADHYLLTVLALETA